MENLNNKLRQAYEFIARVEHHKGVVTFILAIVAGAGMAAWMYLSRYEGPMIALAFLMAYTATMGGVKLTLWRPAKPVRQAEKQSAVVSKPLPLVVKVAMRRNGIEVNEFLGDLFRKRFGSQLIFRLHHVEEGGRVEDRTFEDCNFDGPGIIEVGEGVIFYDCEFRADTYQELFWPRPKTLARGSTVTLVRRCIFRRCEFSDIGISGTKEDLEKLRPLIMLKKYQDDDSTKS